MSKVVGIGVIGCGTISSVMAIPAIKEIENARLVAVSDVRADLAQKLATKYNVKSYTTVEALLNDKEVEAVYIAVPHNLHAELCVQAAQKGKHILIEKPMATNLEECKLMINECEKNDVKLQIAHNVRFTSAVQKTKELMDIGLIGKPVFARAQFSWWNPPDPSSWRQSKSKGGGGSVMDVGIHCIDTLRFLLGDVSEVSAVVDRVAFDYEVEDTALMTLKFTSGAYAFIDACFNNRYCENGLEVYGTGGSILGKDVFTMLGIPFRFELRAFMISRLSKFEIQPVNSFVKQIGHFVECIVTNRNPLVSGTEGMKTMQVAMAAYESAKAQRVVKIS